MKKAAVLLCGLSMLLGCVTASAQSVPQLVSYQGQLLDPSGNPIPTGDYDVEISLFPVASGGAPIWGPQKFNGQSGPGLGAKVPVVNGHFNVILGPQDTGGNDLGSVFQANSSVFLEIKVGAANPMAPRQQMLAAPYALQALTAAGLKSSQILIEGNVGINTPPTNGVALEVKGAVWLKTGGLGGGISFGNPSTETGFTMGILNRADVRFDDSTLKFLAGAGRSPRGIENGLAIATSGNVGIGTVTPRQKLHVFGNIEISNGFLIGDSDVNKKTDFAPVDTASVLERVVKMSIQQWRFKTENPDVKHFGPMAQDFHAAFGLGDRSTGIATVDVDGVALAAIQGLNQKLTEKDAELQELRRIVTELQAQMNQLSGRPVLRGGATAEGGRNADGQGHQRGVVTEQSEDSPSHQPKS